MALEPATSRKWGDVLLGALVSLAVTVVGGIAVYYYSRDSSSPQHESIIYTVDQLASFEADSIRLGLATLRVRNAGSAPAKEVVIALETRAGARIGNHKVSVSSGPAGNFTIRESSPTSLQVEVPNLAPNELLNVNLVLQGPVTDTSLIVGVKSESAIGTKVALFGEAKPTLGRRLMRTLPPFLVLIVLTQVLLFGLLKRLRGAYRNVNNTAFLFLHGGLPEEAGRILESGITSKGADSLMLANYGLTLALAGNQETSEKLFSAAEFYGHSNHEKAVVSFNRALASFSAGSTQRGTELLDRALKLSGREIRKYSRFSNIVKELKGRTPEIATAFAQRSI